MSASTNANQKNQNVGGLTNVLVVSPVITAGSAYAAGQAVGTYSNAAGNSFIQDAFYTGSASNTGILESITVIDLDSQMSGLVFDFFNIPTGTHADKAATTYPDSECLTFLGRISVAAGDYVDACGVAVANVTSINLPVRNEAGDANLYLVVTVLTGSTPTWTATTGRLQFKFGILQD